jgi:hypothetical protein
MTKTINQVEETINNFTEEEAKNQLISLLNDGYILVQWPYSQEFMDEEWFDEEAILADSEQVGSSAYFIPIYKTI